jgi:hypothetical protein
MEKVKMGERKKTATVAGAKLPKGDKMTKGSHWKLVHKGTAGERLFHGTLLETVNHGDVRIAIFSVPKQQG